MTQVRWILPSLDGYQTTSLPRDALAGLVLSALLVPQGMAYAELAGLPPVTGLYTSLLCLVGYALVGPSRILVLGPDSALGPMIAATIIPLVGAGGDPARAIVLASALAALTGALMIAAGASRLGFVADLLSKPTIMGYLNGLALTILVSQLPKLLGFSVDADTFVREVGGVVSGVAGGEVNVASAAIGLFSLALILVLNRLIPKVPAVLLAVVAAIVLSVALSLAKRGVAVVGPLDQGLPSFTLPLVGIGDVALLALGACGISLVALADTISVATAYAERQGDRVNGNREMIGIGVANVATGLFQGFPASTSASRTAVAESAGSRSQITGLVGAGMIALMLVVFPNLLAELPQPTLAAVVIAASMSLADLSGLRRLLAQRKADFWLAIVAFLGVVLVGILPGIILAVAVSVANVFRRIWWPYRAVLGRVDDLPGLHDVSSYPRAALLDACTVYRFDAPLIFANANTFREDMFGMAQTDQPPRWIVVAAEPITDVDTTACDMLEELIPRLDAMGVRLVFAELKDPARRKLNRFGLDGVLADDRFFPTITSAVEAFRRSTGAEWVPPSEDP